MPITLKHATLAQLGTAFRERFRRARGRDAGRLADWLLGRIGDGTFTDAQVRAFFGLSVVDYNALKTRLTVMQTQYQNAEGAQGE